MMFEMVWSSETMTVICKWWDCSWSCRTRGDQRKPGLTVES